MLFNEPRFLAFMIIVWAVAWILKNNVARKWFLLAASYFFYGCWDWRFLGLILTSSATSYVAACEIARNEGRPFIQKAWMFFGVGIGLGMLFVFKYFNFFLSSLNSVLLFTGHQPLGFAMQIILPVGISFFTFQSVSYVLDCYLARSKTAHSVLDYFLYVAFFPQLVAGPIVRATDFLPQLHQRPVFHAIRWRAALSLFLSGYFKKVVVSDNIAPYVDCFFDAPASFDMLDSLLGVTLYSMQIYCDFSGYSDMGIAVAAMLGYRLCVNFAHPYFAFNIAEFWRRWHISLSSWLRDYLYIPLGGNRRGERRTLINLMLTMILGGIWHGAAWTFVIWGAMHGVGLVVHRLWSKAAARRSFQLPSLLAWASTMAWVMLTWVFFRSSGLSDAFAVLASLAGNGSGSNSLPDMLWLHAFVATGIHFMTYQDRWVPVLERLPQPIFVTALGIATAVCLSLVPNAYRPFIYFQF